jgi:hypothetical protein
MRYYAKLEALFFGLALALAFCTAHAAGIVAKNAQLVAGDDGYNLTADFTASLNRRLEEAVNKGVVLYFVADFELTRSRWYWFDQKVVRRSKTFQLSYHALARQYRLSSGALHQSFYSLDEALQVLSHLRHWLVIEKDEIVSEVEYEARTRLRLDPSLMAKTFQVSALSNRDWNQSSDWLVWNFSSATPVVPTDSAESANFEDEKEGEAK